MYINRSCAPTRINPICMRVQSLWSSFFICGCVWCVLVSVPECLRGGQRHLSWQDHCKKRPSSPFSTNSYLLKSHLQDHRPRHFCLSVCDRHTTTSSMSGISTSMLCPPHQGAHLSSCIKTWAQQGAALTQAALRKIMLDMSFTCITAVGQCILKAIPPGRSV